MFYKAKTLKGYTLECTDGNIGQLVEFFFDDRYWTVRYLVVGTGAWLKGRQVLLAPYALISVNTHDRSVRVNLTKKQIEGSPSLDSDKPVSRQFEEHYYGYYGWPNYWSGSYMWGYTPDIVREPEQWKRLNREEQSWDPDLRSTHDVTGRHVEALDGGIGHIDDFIIDEDSWAIRYLIVDTHNWWPGKKVLISPDWIEHVSWSDQKVFINLSREAIKQSPEYTDDSLITRRYEDDLYRHYSRRSYWVSTPDEEKPGLVVKPQLKSVDQNKYRK